MTEELTACYPCAIGQVRECLDPETTEEGLIIPCAVRYADLAVDTARTDGIMAPDQVTDAISTGRKRAALVAPITNGMRCEWAGLRYAGGGVRPIVGCAGNLIADKKGGLPEEGYLQGDRHHGPDKGTLNNAPGTNLHRICVLCHHRWHTLNDEFYPGKRPKADKPWNPEVDYYLHDPNTEASIEEQEAVEAWWQLEKSKRPEYPNVVEGLRKITT